jgi:hypothetical protein
VNRDLFSHDDYLPQIGIDAQQFGDAVAHAGRRQVDHAGVEGMTGLQPFADAVEHRNVTDHGRKPLARTTGRRSEYDVSAREFVTDRAHPPRLGAQDVEHADRVGPGRNLRETLDPEKIGKALDGAHLR